MQRIFSPIPRTRYVANVSMKCSNVPMKGDATYFEMLPIFKKCIIQALGKWVGFAVTMIRDFTEIEKAWHVVTFIELFITIQNVPIFYKMYPTI